MKRLIMISGTMGVGKSATSKELLKLCERAVFLDGDWCWYMSPFVVTAETKEMVMKNIAFTLNGFLACSEYENIIFCWVMNEQSIIDEVISRLSLSDGIKVFNYSLVCTKEALYERVQRDIKDGIRKSGDFERAAARLSHYSSLKTQKIDVSGICAADAARLIFEQLTL